MAPIRTSSELFARAQKVIPGGVNSPVRAFGAVGGQPIFIARGVGSHVFDVEGREYIDYVASWGPLILGHAHPEVTAAIVEAAQNGTTFGAPTEREVLLAERLAAAFPSIERSRLVSSGTEACMSVLRLARAATDRSIIVKADGGYHGHADSLLVRAGSGAATLGLPGSEGVPLGAARDTLVVPYNDLEALRDALTRHSVAAVILEPVAGNIGVVPPASGYLAGARELCGRAGTLFILDEVITGFRVAYGGAQELFGLSTDLCCLGKILGGGLPMAAYAGQARLMDKIAPLGPVYQAGTLSGNPCAVAAGLSTLEILRRDRPYERIDRLTRRLADGLFVLARERGTPVQINRVGSMFTIFFTEDPVTDYASAKRSDTARFARFHQGLRQLGIYWPPSQFEAAFVSAAHSDSDIDRTLEAARAALEDC